MDNETIDVLEMVKPFENEGPNKVISIDEAVQQHVQPGMCIYVRTLAGVYAILRQFNGNKPGFTLTGSGNDLNLILVHAGLVKKLIIGSQQAQRPKTGHSPIFQRAMNSKSIEVEFWSLFSLYQRFMAGAIGVPFIPTRAVIGSTMARELNGLFLEMDDPFGGNKRVGLVKALRPDIAVIRALAADPSGNAILGTDAPQDSWAARGSLRGAIVCAENIVSTEYIRQHNTLVKVPSHMVAAVCHVPLSVHPDSLYGQEVEVFEPYEEDRDFVVEFNEASDAGGETLDRWLKKWVLDCSTHESFLAKLGEERIAGLKQRAQRPMETQAAKVRDPSDLTRYSNLEYMVVGAARKIQEIVERRGYKLLLCGRGLAGLACYQAHYRLRWKGIPLDLVMGTGLLGHLGQGIKLRGTVQRTTAKLIGEALDIYGAFLRGEDSPCLGLLGMAQIDKAGNINTTRLADGTYITGSSGANDCTAGSAEVMVTSFMSRRRFVADEVDYISAPGDRVATVVTDRGILEKLGGDELVLTTYFPAEGVSEADAVAEIKARCGWELQVANPLRREPPPTPEELKLLRWIDDSGSLARGRREE